MGGTLTWPVARAAGTKYVPQGTGTVPTTRNTGCTLLGPEGPGRIRWSSRRESDIPRPRIRNEPLDLFVTPTEKREGTARNLRTTQWTRAS